MAASGEAPGGFGGWVAWWLCFQISWCADGCLGAALCAQQKLRSLCCEAAPARFAGSGYIAMAAGMLAYRAGASVGTML